MNIQTREITKRYGNITALYKISLSFEPGESVALLGKSGSGKSTLLHLLSLLDLPTEGEIQYSLQNKNYSLRKGKLEGSSISSFRSKFGFVFQTPFMLSNHSVLYNVSLPLRFQRKWTLKTADNMLDSLGIQTLSQRFPHEISGGERQRVAVGRSLIHDPEVIFADEPTGSLDYVTARRIMDLFFNLLQQKERDKRPLFLLVTHDIALALQYTERIIGLISYQEGMGANDQIAFDCSKKELTQEMLQYFLEHDQLPKTKSLLNEEKS